MNLLHAKGKGIALAGNDQFIRNPKPTTLFFFFLGNPKLATQAQKEKPTNCR